MTLFTQPFFIQITAQVATFLLATFIVIQLLAAAGLIPVSMLWGGRQTELTPTLRIASIAAAVVLGVFIYIIRYRAGLVGQPTIPSWVRIMSWVITAYMAFNTFGNFASASNIEKWVFGPLTIAITIACLIVSLAAQ